MRKIIIKNSLISFKTILVIGVLMFITNSLYSQQPAFEIEVEIQDASSIKTKDGAILVKSNLAQVDNLFVLYDKVPLANVKPLDKSIRIDNNQYQFLKLKPKTYFVCIYDKDNNKVCEKVELNHK